MYIQYILHSSIIVPTLNVFYYSIEVFDGNLWIILQINSSLRQLHIGPGKDFGMQYVQYAVCTVYVYT